MSRGKFRVFSKVLVKLLVILPLLAWFLFKPIRVLAPEFNGMLCPEKYLCTDDLRKLDHAKKLYEESLLYIGENVGTLNTRPVVIFCSTNERNNAFGLGKRSAMHLPVSIVISSRAWERHYLNHELIHRLQQQEFGILYSYQKPKWYLEGMAYLLSGDPRLELNEPLKKYRQDFKVWFSNVGKDNLWLASEKL